MTDDDDVYREIDAMDMPKGLNIEYNPGASCLLAPCACTRDGADGFSVVPACLPGLKFHSRLKAEDLTGFAAGSGVNTDEEELERREMAALLAVWRERMAAISAEVAAVRAPQCPSIKFTTR